MTNLNLPSGAGIAGSSPFIVYAPEGGVGGQDLNGDGDFDDRVMHLVDTEIGQLLNTELAARLPMPGTSPPEPKFSAAYVVLPVDEAAQGAQDLNGDGDAEDLVLHLVDRVSGDIQVIPFAVPDAGNQGVALSASSLFFIVSEGGQGDTDLNGDGDTLDTVLHVFDLATGMVTSLPGSANGQLLAAGDQVAYSIQENVQSGDLNGDGDELDLSVLQIFDTATGLVTNTGLAIGPIVGYVGGAWLVGVREAAQGMDLNGDLDTKDDVLASFDLVLSETRNHGVGSVNPRPTPTRILGDVIVALVSEVAMGVDLNGDGDQIDLVAHLLDPALEGATNTGFAATEMGVIDGWVSILVDEESQGNTDIDGDGFIFGSVPHMLDPATGAVINLGIGGFGLRPAGRYVYFKRFEVRAQMDLNGDGDQDDAIPHWWDSVTGAVQHTDRSSISVLDIKDGTLLNTVSEMDESEDLNGDGDLNDLIVFAVDLETGTMANTGIEASAGNLADSRTALLQVSEATAGEDLNGDGDTVDVVLFQADLFR